MELEELGWFNYLSKTEPDKGREKCVAGRVIAEHRERYMVASPAGEIEAEITGNMRFTARSREDFPAVGDWVTITPFGIDYAIINQVLPRFSLLKRLDSGNHGEFQVIAANIDVAFLVQAADRDFNINRIERYLTLCHAAKVSPVVVLTKTDLAGEKTIAEMMVRVNHRIGNVPVIGISNQTQFGYEKLKPYFEKGKTCCMLGSSGVGKSTLMNNLSARNIMKTDSISSSTQKGRHVTSHRELVILDNGGILIDNPGMREVGISDMSGGLETTFDAIVRLSASCRFADCTHQHEAGCAVLEAVKNGEIDLSALNNYLRMDRERAHTEMTIAERHKKDKDFGKMIKNVLQEKKKNNY